ncbi:MAG: YjdF family protein [Oscillospiraceae bacterium]|nr:YjdF family protein [Oscillospiraceae bacterium]
METAKAKLTVLFDPPFWIGLFERERAGRYEACRVVFGAEPRDIEVYACILDRYDRLAFSPALAFDPGTDRAVSPKRAQREARRQTRPSGIGTKAQQALQLQREQGREARRVLSREARDAERDRRFQLHREKQKRKHRGR